MQKANGDFEAKTAKLSTQEKLALWNGYTSNAFMAKKARFMSTQADLYFNDFAMRIGPAYNNLRIQIDKMQVELKTKTKQISVDLPDSYEACQSMKEALNVYLKKSLNSNPVICF